MAAGVDENTLRSLYEEIGVKIPPKTPPPITVNDMGQKSSVERPALNGNDSNKGDDGKHRYAPLTQPPPPQPPTPPISANIHQPVQATKVSTELSSAAPADAVIKRPEGIAVAKGTVVKDVPSLSRPKVPAVDSSQAKVMPSSKTMERKDYIARMLAAKAGKLPASPAQSTQAPPLVSAQSKKVNDEENVTASFTVPSREKDKVIESPVTTPKTTDSEAIKQAQTNLARQKMEALRNRTPANSERLGPSQSGPPTSQTALTTQPVSETSTSIQAQHITPVQSSDGQPPPKSNDASQSSSGSSGTLRPDEANISMASFSGIPGLFMTSAPSPRPQVTSSHPILEPGSSNSSTINPVGNSRKRPLAADLNDLASNSIKRPFGQSRQIAVVIDVSDDEAADVYDDSEMDLEDDEEVTVPKQTQTTRGSSMLRGQRNSPVTNDIPVKKPVAATSTLNTPSASQTPGIVKQPGDLKTTEKQIQLMHQRIAELEQRRKSKQINSRAETPGTPEPVAATPNAAASPPNTANELKVHERDAQPLNEDFNEKGEAEKIRIAQAPVTQDMTAVEQQKTIDAQTDRAEAEQIERAKVEAKQVEQALVEAAEQKRRRKAEIEFGLPILDAEVVRTQMKLEEMKKEVHRLEAEVQKGLEGRKSLIAELEGLGIDTEGMPLAELQAKKDEIMKQQTEDRDQGKSNLSPVATELKIGTLYSSEEV